MIIRSRTFLSWLAATGAVLCGSVAQGQNTFILQLNSASAKADALKAGDILKIDLFLKSDGITPIKGYQGAIAFDSAIFDPKTQLDDSIYTQVDTTDFNFASPNGTQQISNRQVFYAGANRTTTKTFSSTPKLLGTFNLEVLSNAPSGQTTIDFSDNLVPPPPLNRSNFFTTTANAPIKPLLQNNIGIVRVAAVPETGTLLGLGSLLGIGGLALRRSRRTCRA